MDIKEELREIAHGLRKAGEECDELEFTVEELEGIVALLDAVDAVVSTRSNCNYDNQGFYEVCEGDMDILTQARAELGGDGE